MGCSHNCSSCASNCENKAKELNRHEVNVKKVIAVTSGKGGVGKSLTTSLLAVMMQRKGYRVAILDADITGPSIPKIFGISSKATGTASMINPLKTDSGIQIISINSLLEDITDPVLWRGALLTKVVHQFFFDVAWDDVDYMFIDMPPGTGEVSLTVFNSLDIDGVIVVSTPQDLVSMIVEKSIKMAKMMNKEILGVIENMSYFVCDSCNKKHFIFGDSGIDKLVEKYSIDNLAKMPLDNNIAKTCDAGGIERIKLNNLDLFIDNLISKVAI